MASLLSPALNHSEVFCILLSTSYNVTSLARACKGLHNFATQQFSRPTPIAWPTVVSSFVASTPLESFANAGTSSKAMKRRRHHFQRTSNLLAASLQSLVSGLRCAFLYDSGALTVAGAHALVQHLQQQQQLAKQYDASVVVNDIVVLAFGEGDAIFFARRTATVRRLSRMLHDSKYRPVLVDVSPSLSFPLFVSWSNNTGVVHSIEASMKAIATALTTSSKENKAIVRVHVQHVQQMISVVGMLLEYPVVYGMFQDGLGAQERTGNCAAAGTLCRHRMVVNACSSVGQGLSKEPDTVDKVTTTLLPWSFTVPKALMKNIHVQLSLALFYNVVLQRVSHLNQHPRGNTDPTVQTFPVLPLLSWVKEDINVTSVCL